MAGFKFANKRTLKPRSNVSIVLNTELKEGIYMPIVESLYNYESAWYRSWFTSHKFIDKVRSGLIRLGLVFDEHRNKNGHVCYCIGDEESNNKTYGDIYGLNNRPTKNIYDQRNEVCVQDLGTGRIGYTRYGTPRQNLMRVFNTFSNRDFEALPIIDENEFDVKLSDCLICSVGDDYLIATKDKYHNIRVDHTTVPAILVDENGEVLEKSVRSNAISLRHENRDKHSDVCVLNIPYYDDRNSIVATYVKKVNKIDLFAGKPFYLHDKSSHKLRFFSDSDLSFQLVQDTLHCLFDERLFLKKVNKFRLREFDCEWYLDENDTYVVRLLTYYSNQY